MKAFWDRVDKSGDCWEWRGYRRASGQGVIGVGGTNVYAHRFAFELEHGPLPEGAKLVATCGSRSCVNPEHMRVEGRLKTHCPAGHEYTAESTYTYPQSSGRGVSRVCKACIRERNEERMRRDKGLVIDVCSRCEKRPVSNPRGGEADGLCLSCRHTLKRNPTVVRRPFADGSKTATLDERFWSKVDIGSESECWPWLASRDKGGYGQFRLDGRPKRAHRVSYELLVEPIPIGFVIDHLCRNASCVNPHHLEVVTLGENSRRANAKDPQ